MIRRISVRLVLFVTVVSTIGCDRVTKHLATSILAEAPVHSYLADTVRLEYAENTGGFLGLGADWPNAFRTALFTTGTGIMLIVLVGIAVRRRWHGWSLIGVCLVLPGGASNVVDRFVRGTVVDFMNVGVGSIRTG